MAERRTAQDRALEELRRSTRLADAALIKRDNLRAQLRVTEETLVAALKRRDYAAASPDLPGVLEAHTGPSARYELAQAHGMTVAVERASTAVAGGPEDDAAEPDDAVPTTVDPWDEAVEIAGPGVIVGGIPSTTDQLAAVDTAREVAARP